MEHQTTIIDLRGPDSSTSEDGFGVLADSTGRRRRGLRRIGRAVAVLFAIWLAALALAGVGLLPGVGVPLASRSGADGAPPPIDDRSPLVATKGTRPALTRAATGTAIPAARATPTSARAPAPFRHRSVTRRRNVAPERHRTAATAPATSAPVTAPAAATPAPSRRATPAGQAVIAPGHSGAAPGQTRPVKTPAPAATPTPIHGKSDSAPGRTGR